MEKIIHLFGGDDLTLETAARLNPEEMTREELLALIPRIEKLYDLLQDEEPDDDDPESEEYLAWEEDLELLDDLLDEIQDLLEE